MNGLRSALIAIALTVLGFLLFGMWGAISPTTGPIVFLTAEVAWLIYGLFRLIRGLRSLRFTKTAQGEKGFGFGIGVLLTFAGLLLVAKFFPIRH